MGKPNRLVGPLDFGREAIFSKAQFFMALYQECILREAKDQV